MVIFLLCKCAFKNCGIDVMLNEFNSHLITSHSSVPENLEYGALVKEISLSKETLLKKLLTILLPPIYYLGGEPALAALYFHLLLHV